MTKNLQALVISEDSTGLPDSANAHQVPPLRSGGEAGMRAVGKTVFNKMAQLGINAGTGILTARALMPSGRGDLAALILWPLFLTYVTTLGIPSAIIYALRQEEGDDAKDIVTGFLMTIVLGFAAAVFGAVCLPLWLSRQYSPEIVHVAQWFLVITPILAVTQMGRAVLEAKSLFSRSNWMLISTPSTTLAILLLLLAFHRLNPFTGGVAYMVGALPPFVMMLVWLRPMLVNNLKVSKASAKKLLSYGIRSFGVDLLGTLALQVDQVLVISLLPPASMGVYGVMLSLSRMFNIFQGSVVMVLFPKAAGQSVDKVLELTEQSARISTLITGLCCLCVSVFGFTVLRLLYGKAYTTSAGTLRLLLIEVTLSGCVYILAQAFMALGHPGAVSILQAIGLASSVPLMLYFIPRLGIIGAALSLLLSTILRLLVVYFGFYYVLGKRLPRLIPTSGDVRLLARAVLSHLGSRESVHTCIDQQK
jgi:O-antigen/teichoic acid export membrane protein